MDFGFFVGRERCVPHAITRGHHDLFNPGRMRLGLCASIAFAVAYKPPLSSSELAGFLLRTCVCFHLGIRA